MNEIEAKYGIEDIDGFLKRHDSVLHSVFGGEIFVLDVYYDHPKLNIDSEDKVLRLRQEGEAVYIAFKGPRTYDQNLIKRPEFEPGVSDFQEMEKGLELIGFEPHSRVEKYRTTLKHDEYPNVSIEIDRYPFIGYQLEIEGEQEDVDAVSNLLGLRVKDRIQKNCTELFLDYLAAHGIEFDNPKLHFTFKDEAELG